MNVYSWMVGHGYGWIQMGVMVPDFLPGFCRPAPPPNRLFYGEVRLVVGIAYVVISVAHPCAE